MLRFDEDFNQTIEFLENVNCACLLRLAKPLETKIEYLCEILGKNCSDVDELKETMIYAVRFYVGTQESRNNTDFIKKCTVKNLTEIVGFNNIAAMARMMDLCNSIGREIILEFQSVCFVSNNSSSYSTSIGIPKAKSYVPFSGSGVIQVLDDGFDIDLKKLSKKSSIKIMYQDTVYTLQNDHNVIELEVNDIL